MKKKNQNKKTPPKKGLQNSRELSCSKKNSAQFSSGKKVGTYALPATSVVLPGHFFFPCSLASLLIIFQQEFGVRFPTNQGLLPSVSVIVQKHVSAIPFF